jgi:glycerophosphoryl diester phosphodiesterase
MEHGVDFSELDVFVSRDGDLVVTHDPVDDAQAERALPRLAEVLALVDGRMGIYVELKGERTGLALGDLVRRGQAGTVRLIAGSFVLDLVAELREAAPSLPSSILFGPDWLGRVEAVIDACQDLGAVYAHPCFRPIDRALVEALHQARLQVMTPHTNDAQEARYFRALGVDVIASDDPRVLLPLRIR